jgi:hypothetical protein
MRTGRALKAGGLAVFLIVIAPLMRPQGEPPKKTTQDYMGAILSKNTKPLGLIENKALNDYLRQPGIAWAIRAASRHILD